jgi:hypothetical protein
MINPQIRITRAIRLKVARDFVRYFGLGVNCFISIVITVPFVCKTDYAPIVPKIRFLDIGLTAKFKMYLRTIHNCAVAYSHNLLSLVSWNLSHTGFILDPGCALDTKTPAENIHALVESGKQYGVNGA